MELQGTRVHSMNSSLAFKSLCSANVSLAFKSLAAYIADQSMALDEVGKTRKSYFAFR